VTFWSFLPIWQRSGTGSVRNFPESGIYLHNVEDQLLWAGGDNSGLISVRNIYTTISNTTNNINTTGWRKHLWTWKIPLKVKLFIWLADKNKISTWDNLQRKAGTVPISASYASRKKNQ
jgi:hypothetical protein